MFANLQNKINLKKLNENRVDVDPRLVYQEPFNVINSTIDYFIQDKDVINNVVFKEEVIEYENQENVIHLTNMVVNEQKFIYNNDITLNHLIEENLLAEDCDEEPAESEELELEPTVLDDEDADIMQFINNDDGVINEDKSERKRNQFITTKNPDNYMLNKSKKVDMASYGKLLFGLSGGILMSLILPFGYFRIPRSYSKLDEKKFNELKSLASNDTEAKKLTNQLKAEFEKNPLDEDKIKYLFTAFKKRMRILKKKSIREEELIVGGLADGMSIDDIAEKHGVGISQITSQVEKGIDIEMEHVNDAARAKEIALDHLFEFPDYYDRLEKMENEAKSIHENYNKYHKVKGILPTLLEEVNDEQKLELDRYRMVHNDLEHSEEYDVKDLFDADIIDIAKNEHLEHIQTMNWLENKLRDYSKEMNSDLKDKFLITIENNLKKLDVNNTEELKNKIKDVNGTIKILKERQGLVEGDRNE